MIKKFADYFSIFLISIALITHLLKLIYIFYKPKFLSKYKYFSKDMPSKTDLILYYILTIGCCFFVLFNFFR